MVCICNPLTDKANPANKAVIALGTLNFKTMVKYSGCPDSKLNMALITSLIGMLTEPIKTSKMNKVISKTDKTTQINVNLFLVSKILILNLIALI